HSHILENERQLAQSRLPWLEGQPSLGASIAGLGETLMITVEQCAAFAGLASNEIVLGATSSPKHRVLLSGYLLNLWRGPKAVRKMIVADIRMWLDLGMPNYAADLLVVLRRFLS